MNKLVIIAIIGIAVAGLISAYSINDQFAGAHSTKKIHFTQTIDSSQDLGQGHQNHQLALIIPPTEGALYDGSLTFTSSEPVQLFVLHEISPQEAKDQQTWSVDGKTVYGLSLIDSEKSSGSFEFTGAAVGLHSISPEQFTATVSIDGWIRGQSAGVVLQKPAYEKDEQSLLLSRTSVPATIPMHEGMYQSGKVLYIITDASDRQYSDLITKAQGWNVTHSVPLADAPEQTLQKIYLFKNGVKGQGILGYQSEIFSTTPAQESKYSALGSVVEITWKPGQIGTILESEEDILQAAENKRVEINKTGVVLNTPQVVWPDGQMLLREGTVITDDISYDGGQVTDIDAENMTVTFVAHRGWGPDGKTAYYIITDATPSGPAHAMGAVFSPASENLVASPAAVDFYQFKNGLRGSGPLGFQASIASASLGDVNYSPMWRIYVIEWHDADSARVLETKSDIDYYKEQDMISISIARPANSYHIVNCPFIDPFQ